ncbi:hypothetical protein C0585_02850 [Candidatus Woesearchaeota archaeon]|nr:MAG: hypothetical protein C0585_02850 [Candidatus Woesearchaeota archaeon]
MIIGLTGIIGAGKGTVADILKEKGFIYTSLSDVIREELKKKGSDITRENLTSFAKELREKGGPGVLAKMLSEKIDPNKDFIIDSIRHPKEIEILKENFPDFKLLRVTAPLKVCLRRIQARNRENDPKTLAELLKQLDKENNDNNQQLNNTIDLADIEIRNDGTIDELREKILKIL